MQAFYNIIQECAKIKDKKYPTKENFSVFSNNNNDTHLQVNLLMYKLNSRFCESEFNLSLNKTHQCYRIANAKHMCFKHDLLKNPDFSKKPLIDIFSKAQKCYFGFELFSKIYKTKKYQVVVKDDLMLNTLDANNKNVFTLIQNKSTYLFSIRDLANIIETALSHNDCFFPLPMNPKNPYNNISFTKANLINIYFKIKESILKMPPLLHQCFLCEFDIDKFLLENESLLRDISIRNFVFNTPSKILVVPILRMLQLNRYTRYLKIHDDFPKEKLVSIFRPYIHLFYIINYDIKTTDIIISYEDKLHEKLKEFYLFNTNFGKRMIKFENSFSVEPKKIFVFNDDHINFYGKITRNIIDGRIMTREENSDKIIETHVVKYADEINNDSDSEEEQDRNLLLSRRIV
jgi:hypothetical protein